jgi:periplasmic protein TonB
VGAAGLLLLTPRLRPRAGPALRPTPLPVTATVLSVITHAALAGIVLLGAHAFARSQPKIYVVNLVPAVAAVGTPQGRPAQPPRPENPPPVARRAEVPEREAPRTAPPAPAPPPDLPPRAAATPDLPTRAPSLPDRTPVPRPPTTPRVGDKELPPMASAAPPPTPAPAAPPAPAPGPVARAEPPPPALGQRSGSAQGSGAVTLDVSDFPFAWYLAAIHRKVTERWEGRALAGRQPVITFEISRDGQVSSVSIKDSSGNPYYDRTAMRAIAEAAPFPRLPDEFPGSVLRVHMGFNFAQDRG